MTRKVSDVCVARVEERKLDARDLDNGFPLREVGYTKKE